MQQVTLNNNHLSLNKLENLRSEHEGLIKKLAQREEQIKQIL